MDGTMKILIFNNCNELTEKEFMRAFMTLGDKSDLDINIFDNTENSNYNLFKKYIIKSKVDYASIQEVQMIDRSVKGYDCIVSIDYCEPVFLPHINAPTNTPHLIKVNIK